MKTAIELKHLKFSIEPFAAVYDEAIPLLRLHWEEIARNKKLLTINPDLEKYKRLATNLLLITARYEGNLVGYFLWMLVMHPHYKHVLVAEEDLHFLLPEFRFGLAGYKLLKTACEMAIEAGAKILVMREKIGHEHPALMERLRFVPTDIIYTFAVEGK